MNEQKSQNAWSFGENRSPRFILVKEGDRWRCIRCAICCHTDFEEEWLDFLDLHNSFTLTSNRCPNLVVIDNRSHCRIYQKRPNQCRAFPFSLRKDISGRHVLVIHSGCKGYGKGRVINLRKRIATCVMTANREFNLGIEIDFTGSNETPAVLLKCNKKEDVEKLVS